MVDTLGLLAEIAAAFTGFAALVSTLGKGPSAADQRLDRMRLRNLVEMGVVIVLMGTLPLVLSRGEAPDETIWVVCSTGLLAAIILFAVIHGGRVRAIRGPELAGYSRLAALLTWAIGWTSMGVLVTGLLMPSIIGRELAYGLAMWLMTLALGIYFIRIAASLLTHRVREDFEA